MRVFQRIGAAVMIAVVAVLLGSRLWDRYVDATAVPNFPATILALQYASGSGAFQEVNAPRTATADGPVPVSITWGETTFRSAECGEIRYDAKLVRSGDGWDQYLVTIQSAGGYLFRDRVRMTGTAVPVISCCDGTLHITLYPNSETAHSSVPVQPPAQPR